MLQAVYRLCDHAGAESLQIWERLWKSVISSAAKDVSAVKGKLRGRAAGMRVQERRDRVAAIELWERRVPPVTMDSFERLLWWLFAGSAGARTRALVLYAIRDQPRNAQQLSQALGLDYTTVRHHLRVLETNRLIVSEGEKYGRIYFVADGMEAHWNVLESMLMKIGGKKARSEGKNGKRTK